MCFLRVGEMKVSISSLFDHAYSRLRRTIWTLTVVSSLGSVAVGLPPGFVEENVLTGLSQPVGVTFSTDGRLFFWEKAGRVFIVENGVKRLLLDISAEVLNWWDHGLLGFALDPDFNSNGNVYLLYAVDYEYLVANGDPQGANPLGGPSDQMRDTIGRLTRYTCTNPATSPIVNLGSWTILIGHWQTNPNPPHVTDGIPMTSSSHGPDTLAFASDGTLLVSIGDGGQWQSPDSGGPRVTPFSTNTAESDGILTPAEQVGSFRAQLVNSYNGKILRLDADTIDPLLGCAGVPSNPYFEAAAPYSPKSKTWAMGFRNPFRFALRPGTGQADPLAGEPGTIYVGDVGVGGWEEIDVVSAARARLGNANFGWPRFEGHGAASGFPSVQKNNLDAPNPLFDNLTCTQQFFYFNDLIVEAVDTNVLTPSWPNPCDGDESIPSELTFMHQRPLFDWRHGTPQTRIPVFNPDGTAATVNIDDPSSPVVGASFAGPCALGGVFYTGDKFPPEYQGTYFFGDCWVGWIRNLVIDGADIATEIRDYQPLTDGRPVCFAVDPAGYGLYYVSFTNHRIKRIVVDCNGNGGGDDRDIALGTSRDCNANGLPDECDPESRDIDLFVGQLLAATQDPVPICMWDANADSRLDGKDIAAFVEAWLSP